MEGTLNRLSQAISHVLFVVDFIPIVFGEARRSAGMAASGQEGRRAGRKAGKQVVGQADKKERQVM